MADDTRLIAVIEANTKSYENAMKRLERVTNQTMARAAKDTKALDASLKATASTATIAAQRFASFGKSLAGAFGIGVGLGLLTQLPSAIRGAVAEAAKIGDVADKVGITTDALQALHHQAEQNASSADAMDAALEQFARRTSEAARGSGDLSKILKANNVELRNSDGTMKSLEQRLADYADLIANAANESDALALATEAFGRAGDDMAVVFREGSGAIREYIAEGKRLGLFLDADLIKKMQKTDDEFAILERRMSTFAKGEVLQFVEQLTQAFEDLSGAVGAAGGVIKNIAAPDRLMSAIIDQTKVWRNELQTLRPIVEEIKTELALTKLPLNLIQQQTIDEFTELQAKLRESNEELFKLAETDLTGLGNELNKVLQNLKGWLPILTGIGEAFGLWQQQASTIIPNVAAAAKDQTTELIKHFEGFISTAKFDVNAPRVGFGSDTLTSPTGQVSAVTMSSTTTMADAERDLARRIGEFQGVIVQQIGDAFGRFTAPVQAALTSVAYNYGRLPPTVAAAARTGDTEAVAVAVENLSANPQRRQEEAALIRTGEFGLTEQHAAATQAMEEERRKTEDLTKAKADFDAMLKREGESIQLEIESMGKSTAAAEYAAVKQDLLNQLTAAGIPLTKEYAAAIEDIANASAARVTAGEIFAVNEQKNQDAMQETVARADEIRNLASDVLGGLASDLANGVKPAEALANALGKIAQKLIDIGVNAIVSGIFGPAGTPLGGLFGGGAPTAPLIQGGLFHQGGIVGAGGPSRMVPASAFVGAPRYHSGGVAGFRAGEMPAILQKGEIVIPKLMARGGGGQQQRVNVHSIVELKPSPEFVGTVETISQQHEDNAVRRAPGHIANQQSRRLGGAQARG